VQGTLEKERSVIMYKLEKTEPFSGVQLEEDEDEDDDEEY